MTTSPNRNTQANQEPITPVMDLRGGREGGRERGREGGREG